MSLLKGKETLNGNISGRLKRGTALLMAAILMFSPMPGVSFVSRADRAQDKPETFASDRLTQDDTLKNIGGGFTTSWRVGGGSFDIEGIEDPQLMHPYDSEASYNGNRDQAVETTHLHSGFHTYIQSYNQADPSAVNRDEEAVPLTDNGAVYDFPDKGIQVQIKLHPTWDHKFIQADYVVHNIRSNSNKIQLGTSADLQLGKRGTDAVSNPSDPSDSSLLNVNSRGIHMINTGTRSSFECMFNYHDLDLTKPDSVWVGNKADLDVNHYRSQASTQGGDAAMSYSWIIDLDAGQTVTKSVAFGAKGASYYVNQAEGNDSNDGTYARPFQTIERAMQYCDYGRLNYIYLQDDFTSSSVGYSVKTKSIEFSSADYDKNGSPSDTIWTIRGVPSPWLSLGFYPTSGGTVRLGNLTLDAQSMDNYYALVSSSFSNSYVAITSGTTLKGSKNRGNTGAVVASNGAKLFISNATIIDNSDGINFGDGVTTGAVNIYNSSTLAIEGKCVITDNTDFKGRAADVLIDPQNTILVMDNLGGSKIGIDVKTKIPDISADGKPTAKASQEIILAKPAPGSVADKTPCSFADKFFANSRAVAGLYTAVGTENLTGEGDHNDRNLVLRRHGFGIDFAVTVKDGDTPIESPPIIEPQVFEPNQPIGDTGAAPIIPQYKFYETRIDQGAVPMLHAAAPEDPKPGSITGIMPSQNVTVTYVYEQLKTQITFDTNGGITDDGQTKIPAISGKSGSPMPAEPKLAKEGYTFKGWSTENSGPSSPLFSWPSVFPDVPDGLKLYAVFGPDSSKKYNYTTEYTDETGLIVFKIGTEPDKYSVEDSVTAKIVKIPGYTWDKTLSATSPSDIGSFDDAGNYIGTMPAGGLTVHYGYRTDGSQFPLIIQYQSVNGAQLAPPSAPSDHAPGEMVTADPKQFDHYRCSGGRFDKGKQDGETANGFVKPVTGQPDPTNLYHWSAPMPNQSVTLTYLYTGDGAETSNFKITQSYEDAGSDDPALQTIIEPIVQDSIPVDQKVDGAYTPLYGYLTPGTFEAPVTDAPLGTNIAFLSGADQGKWSGAMPAGDVTITYRLSRDLPKWAEFTYQAGPNGTLTLTGTKAHPQAASPDVKDNGDGTYQAGILISDASLKGQAGAYRFVTIKNKNLLPNPEPADPDYYRFKEWLVAKADSKPDVGEGTPCEDDQTFTGPATLIAAFEEIPEKWTDIHFNAEHADLKSDPKTEILHIRTGGRWGDLRDADLPSYQAWPHYKDGGWYDGDTKMTPESPIENGHTYTHKYKVDPSETFDYTVEYVNSSSDEANRIVFRTLPTATHSFLYPVSAPDVTVPGYLWNKGVTDPPDYQFTPHGETAPIGTFGSDGSFTGMMPGENLKVTSQYKPDPGQTCTLTVKYLSESDVLLADEDTEQLTAEAPIDRNPKTVTGYTCSGFEFQTGSTPDLDAMITAVRGEPDVRQSYRWVDQMPNQDVTLIYRYRGDASVKHTLTQEYLDEGSDDPVLQRQSASWVKTDIIPGTKEEGTYAPQYGYQKADAVISYAPKHPAGADFTFADEAKTRWSGHMPAADVTITYRLSRNPAQWVTLTYAAGPHGHLSAEGQSTDLKPAVGTIKGYTAQVLKDDTADASNTPDTFGSGTIGTKKLMPIPVSENSELYEFAGWQENDGSAVADGQTFKKDTVLTATFKEKEGAWINLTFTAEKGRLKGDHPHTLKIPKGSKTWGDIQDELPGCEPWTGYKKDDWYDADGNPMKPETLLTADETFTFRCIPDLGSVHSYTVKYTNEDGSIVFNPTAVPENYPIMKEVKAKAAKVQGYTWDQHGVTDPAEYLFDPDGRAVPIGSFEDSGSFTGTMPGTDLTVLYRYKRNPSQTYHLQIRYETDGGSGRSSGVKLSENTEEDKAPGDEIKVGEAGSKPVDGYRCTGFNFETGKENHLEDDTLVLPVKGDPIQDHDHGYQWSSVMPNQDVTLVYLYKGDEDARFKLTEQYLDDNARDSFWKDIIKPPLSAKYQAGAPVRGTYQEHLYGYEMAGAGRLTEDDLTLSSPWTGAQTITIREDGGGFSGTMLPRDVTVHYHYQRLPHNPEHPDQPDAAHPWGTLVYLPGEHGSLGDDGASSDMTAGNYPKPDGSGAVLHGYQAEILLDDGAEHPAAGGRDSSPYSLGELKTGKLMPECREEDYYQFEGWFVDKNGNGIRDTDPAENEPLITGDQTFRVTSSQADRTLTASFTEKPGQWITVHLKGENTTDDVTLHDLHVPFNQTWGYLGEKGLLPTYTAKENYRSDIEEGGWHADGRKVSADAPLRDGQTYVFVCSPDPDVFGTDVKQPEASGGIDEQGKGQITVYDAKEGYRYILTDLTGTVLTVLPGSSQSQKAEFSGLQPEGRYDVYEAVGTVAAAPGDNIQALGLIGGEQPKISEPCETLVPVLEDNYHIYYNDELGDGVTARLSVDPADPASDYAVLDSEGRTVPIPGAKDGWSTPSGAAPAVQVPGLTYGETYTVAARPKRQTNITAESRKEDGTVITAEPAGEPPMQNKYIIKTISGEIEQIKEGEKEIQVQDTVYADARKGDLVILSAPQMDESGHPFDHWETVIGSLDGQTDGDGQPLDPDGFEKRGLTFTMPGQNLVLAPVYRQDSDSNASVTYEVRGRDKKGAALDSDAASILAQELTKAKDKELIREDSAEVVYKVIYKKSAVKADEIPLIHDSDSYPTEHEAALHGAWGLNVELERYVNGRKTPLASPADAERELAVSEEAADAGAATPSEPMSESRPEPFKTYIQMGEGDTDMMDYQLYEVIKDDDGKPEAVLVSVTPVFSPDGTDETNAIEKSGGLFSFDAKIGSRYVMIYDRAYHLYFTNELPSKLNKGDPQYYQFKVRQNEAPDADFYSEEYGKIPVPPSHLFNDKSGAEYKFKDWSYSRDNNQRSFDPVRRIKNTSHLYAYYENNETQIAEERRKLTQDVKDAETLRMDPFLSIKESSGLKGDIEDAAEVLRQKAPRAPEKDLKKAREKLEERIKYYKALLQNTNKQYQDIKDQKNGGGSGGGGGSGHGSKSHPFSATPERNYTAGTNGSWKLVGGEPEQKQEWAFVLNGGMELKSMWAFIRYPDPGNSAQGWYHFNRNAVMDTGWYTDETGTWHYSYQLNEGPEGKMTVGWYLDARDGNWYYLDPVSGNLTTGWRQIDGKWYYFETVGAAAYTYDAAAGRWIYGGGGNGKHPLGSMYKNEKTPDGYTADENGAWIQ